MFKMLFSTVLLAAMLALGNGFVHAATVTIALDTPAGMFSEPEKVNESLQATLDKIFAGNSNLTFLPIEDATVTPISKNDFAFMKRLSAKGSLEKEGAKINATISG